MIKGILFEDLKIGVNAKSINKVWKGLVPEFNDTLPRDKRPYCDRVAGWDVKSE